MVSYEGLTEFVLRPAVQWSLLAFFLLLSALFSGLTIGYQAYDLVGLEVVLRSGTETTKKYAATVMSIRRRGTWLLCTLTLVNWAANVLIAILLADLTTGLVGILLATILIALFAEVMPQVVCHSNALAVGYYGAPIMTFFLYILSPITLPLGFIFDLLFGGEFGTIYTREEFKELLKIQANAPGTYSEEHNFLTGTLELSSKQAHQVMTPIDRVFMLNIEGTLDAKALQKILKRGFSRLPVYKDKRTNIVSLLFTKDLMLLDPEDNISIRKLVEVFGRNLPSVFWDTTLDAVMGDLQKGQSHIALVRRVVQPVDGSDPYYEFIGVITLEDIIEEILGSEIVDERDIERERDLERASYHPYEDDHASEGSSMARHNQGEDPDEPGMVVSFLEKPPGESYNSGRSDGDDDATVDTFTLPSSPTTDRSKLLESTSTLPSYSTFDQSRSPPPTSTSTSPTTTDSSTPYQQLNGSGH